MAAISGLSSEDPMEVITFLAYIRHNSSLSKSSCLARITLGSQNINVEQLSYDVVAKILQFQADLKSGLFTPEMNQSFEQITASVTGQIGVRMPSPYKKIDSPACPSPKTPPARFFAQQESPHPSFPEHVVHHPKPITKKRTLSYPTEEAPPRQQLRLTLPDRKPDP